MPSRPQLTASVLACAVIFTVIFGIQGKWSMDHVASTLAVVGPLVIIYMAFDHILWRLPFLRPWLVPFSNINGTWRGELVSSRSDEDGSEAKPKEVFLVVRQTFFALSMRLITRESESESLASRIVRSEDGREEVTGTYRNTSKPQFRRDSPIHYGAVKLAIRGVKRPTKLEGEYWTARGTQGTLVFTKRVKTKHDDFDEALTDKWG